LEEFAAHAADVTDLEALLKFVKAYYEFDEIPYRTGRIRAALRILLKDPSLGRVWMIRYGDKAVGHAILTLDTTWSSTAAKRRSPSYSLLPHIGRSVWAAR
jgi:hypothetical protein